MSDKSMIFGCNPFMHRKSNTDLFCMLVSQPKLNGDLKFTSVNVEAIDKVGVNICVVLSKLPSDAL